MAALHSPHSSAVVEVSDDLVERFEAAGYTRVAKPEPKKAPAKKQSESDDSSE